MTREEEIKINASKYIENNSIDGYVQADHEDSFIAGAQWADNHPKSPWISVDDDLPCNPKYLKQPDQSPWVLAITETGEILSAQMIVVNGDKWVWHSHVSRKHEDIRHWMPIIPMLPKEYEHIWEFKL